VSCYDLGAMARWWRRVLSLLGVLRAFQTLLALVPSPYREVWLAAALGLLGGLVAAHLAWLERAPAHVALLAGVWALAAVAFFTWVTLWLYWRCVLLRLIRDVEHFLGTGAPLRDALHAERNPAILAGHVRRVDEWRRDMHARVLSDPRVRPFREGLTDSDPERDLISLPLTALEQVHRHLVSHI
jgi:hypothetical protein